MTVKDKNADWIDKADARAAFAAWARGFGGDLGKVLVGVVVGAFAAGFILYWVWVTKWSLTTGAVELLSSYATGIAGAAGAVVLYFTVRFLTWIARIR